jgi:hypothetical protein
MNCELHAAKNASGGVCRNDLELNQLSQTSGGGKQTAFRVDTHVRNCRGIRAPRDRIRQVNLLSASDPRSYKLFATAIGNVVEAILGGDLD